MLKPKKRKDGAVILTPRISVAVGKKLVVQDGKWLSDGFHSYSAHAMADNMRVMHNSRGRNRRDQYPKPIRVLATWYMRYMQKNFGHDKSVGKIVHEYNFKRAQKTLAGGEVVPPPRRLGYMSVDRAVFELQNAEDKENNNVGD